MRHFNSSLPVVLNDILHGGMISGMTVLGRGKIVGFTSAQSSWGPINKKSYAELMPNLGQTLDIRKT